MERSWSAKPARFSAPPCARLPISTEHDLRSNNKVERDDEIIALWLLRRLLQRRDARQDDLDSGTAARLGIEVEPAAEAVGDDAIDDMQSEPSAALIPAGREERVEGAAADVEAH